MESAIEGALMKSNSAVACIKSGYRLFAVNFKTLFRRSWAWAVAFGLIFGALCTVAAIQLPAIVTRLTISPDLLPSVYKEYLALVATALVLIIAGGIAELFFYACSFSLLREHAATGSIARRRTKWIFLDRRTAWRTVKGVLAALLLTLVAGAIVSALFFVGQKTGLIRKDAFTGLTIWAVISIALMVVTTVVALFVTMKYIIDDRCRYWPLAASDTMKAMRHFGFIFVILLFSGIIMAAATFVLGQPALLLSTATTQAYAGTALGDPLGMPAYITPLSFVVFALSGFLQAYIRASTLFPLYYMYGSIETQEKEKKQYNYDITHEQESITD